MTHAHSLSGSYDLWLVGLSLAVAVGAAYAALMFAGRIAGSAAPGARRLWLAVGALMLGSGIWTMHFIGMLAFHLPLEVSYDISLTALSMVVAVGCAALALSLIHRRTSLSRASWLVGGTATGAGVAAMHYTGMAALCLPAQVTYEPGWVAISVLVAIAAAHAALYFDCRFKSAPGAVVAPGKLCAALFLGGGIAAMHFTAMAAAQFEPAAGPLLCAASAAPAETMALLLIVAVAVMLLAGLLLAFPGGQWRSVGITGKIALLAFILVLATAGTVGAIAHHTAQKRMTERIAETLVEDASVKRAQFAALIESLRQDALYLASAPSIHSIGRALLAGGVDPVDGGSTEAWRERLAQVARKFLRIKPYYRSIHYVSTLSPGGSLVHAVRADGARVAPAAMPGSAALEAVRNLPAGTVQLSAVEREDAVDNSTPETLVIRAATPVYLDSGERVAAVIITMDLGDFVAALAEPAGSHRTYHVTDSGGTLLGQVTPGQPATMWFSAAPRIQDLYPDLMEVFGASSPAAQTVHLRGEQGGGLLHFRKLFYGPANTGEFLGLGVAVPEGEIIARSAVTDNSMALLTLGLIGVATLLSLLFARLITRPLEEISRATAQFAQGKDIVCFPDPGTGDEIGELAQAFHDMAHQVHERAEELRRSERYLRKIVDNAADGIITIDHQGIIRSFNAAAEHIFGYAAGEAIGSNIRMLMAEPHRSQHDQYLRNYLATGVAKIIGRKREVLGQRKDDGLVPLEIAITEMESGAFGGQSVFIGTVHDITRRKKAEENLRMAATVMETSLEAIVITDRDNNIVAVNPAFTEITGYTAQEVLGKNPRLLKSGRHDADFYRQLWDSIVTTGGWQGEIWDRRKNGEIFPKWLSVSAIRDEQGNISHYVAISSDITERKLAEDRLEHLAHYDTLTNLPNRLLFHDRLHQAIEYARRNNSILALLFLDLDRFKVVNDTYGHDVGDLLLVEVVTRLKSMLREIDTIARLGGDEFTVVLEDITHPEDASKLAGKIIETLSKPYRAKGHECYVGVSIGISVFPADGDDDKVLLKHADIAMYRAKDKGRNRYQEYNQTMSHYIARRLDLETRLRHALELDEFELNYQPQISLTDGRIIAVEALIRWRSADIGPIAPVDLIPIAEDTGLIHPIGEWVLKTACQQHDRWRAEGYGHLRIAVNLSARQLIQRDLPRIVQKMLDQSGTAARFLELELTESAVIEHFDQATPVLHELNQMGVQLSLDDFGTGYSSLSYLKRLPVYALKIDRSFVRDVTTDQDDAEIVKAIIAMGHSLDLKVVAEGVETAEQLAFLSAQRCDYVQGYLFSPPVDARQLSEMLRNDALAQALSQVKRIVSD